MFLSGELAYQSHIRQSIQDVFLIRCRNHGNCKNWNVMWSAFNTSLSVVWQGDLMPTHHVIYAGNVCLSKNTLVHPHTHTDTHSHTRKSCVVYFHLLPHTKIHINYTHMPSELVHHTHPSPLTLPKLLLSLPSLHFLSLSPHSMSLSTRPSRTGFCPPL